VKKLPILTFHSIDRSRSVISMPPPDFVRIMEGLAEDGWRGCTISGALTAWKEGAGSQNEGTRDQRIFGLSFDDGYRSVMEEAVPVLTDLGFTATLFAVAGRCGTDNQWPGQAAWVPPMQLLDWPDHEALMAAGWEIGSHGWSHLPLTAIAKPAVLREVEDAKDLLERNLAVQVPLFAYPYGAHDETVREIVRDYHEAACGVRVAAVSRNDVGDGSQLPRIDAHYLRRFPASLAIGSPAGAVYLAVRRLAAGLRRSHWDDRTVRRLEE